MTDLIELQTSELTGEPLAWSVAKAEGLTVFIADPQYGNPYRVMVHFKPEGKLLPQQERFKPQVEWSQGGPLIEKYKVLLTPPTDMVHRNFGSFDSRNGWYESGMWGSTIFGKDRKHRRTAFHHPDSPLIAAMRAIVQFELGDTVQVPKELIQ